MSQEQQPHRSSTLEFNRLKAVVEQCISNAQQLLNAAELAKAPERNHIAFHLALIALEELGKASMVTASSVAPEAPGKGPRPLEQIDDHEKKIFWALWSPLFGRKAHTVQEFRSAQSAASTIHQLRLASLYVDPLRDPSRANVADDQLDAMLSLAHSTLKISQANTLQEVGVESQEHLNWFFSATEDPRLTSMIFSSNSFAKLSDLNGNAQEWVKWLRSTIEEMDRANQELASRELNRSKPEGTEAKRPKWRIRIRLSSWAHSIRPKHLSAWNQRVESIRLTSVEKNLLLVEFSMPAGISVTDLWRFGMQQCTMFVVALNIGSFGFFWWYLPAFTAKYYERIDDLENNSEVSLELAAREPSWADKKAGRHVLESGILANSSIVLSHLLQLRPPETEPYLRYFKGLALLAKSDVFLPLETTILMEFYGAFCDSLNLGGWDGKPENLHANIEAFVLRHGLTEGYLATAKQVVDLCEKIKPHASSSTLPFAVTIEDAARMKMVCDVYFFVVARERMKAIARQHEVNAGANSTKV